MKAFIRLGLALSAAVVVAAGPICSSSSLQALLPPTATIEFAKWSPNNSTFTVPSGDIAYPTSPTQLRAVCAVQIAVKNNGSNYGFGVFLPDDWNGRFLAVGNGGFAGGINWLDMAAGLGYGFAVVSTDTGHNSTSADGTWAYKNPDVREDWGHRALHGSVVLGKSIVAAYYSTVPKYSYYHGCSTGGRQGLRAAQLYPSDFDGVIAGSPAWWSTHLSPWTLKSGTYNLPNTSIHHIPPTLFPIIGAEVLRQCDPVDGVNDTIISSPKSCNFNPIPLLCGPKQNVSECLTSPQLDTLQKLQSDYVDVNQTFVFPGLWLGSEAQWVASGLGGTTGAPPSLGTDYVKSFLDRGPDWRWQDYDYGVVEEADAKDPGNATADDFGMEGFRGRGGKMLMYHGMADAIIPTGSSVWFWEQVQRTLLPKGVDVEEAYRFFLVPGMQHCHNTPSTVNAPWYFAGSGQAGALSTSLSGTPGYEDATHDVLRALVAWVEDGVAPEEIVATKWVDEELGGEVQRQRPLCVYPKVAKWDGVGDVDEAGSWACE